MAGIAFPGLTYPEVNRLGQFTMPDSVKLRDDGDYDVPGLGRLRAGFTRTERGEFAIASYTPNDVGVYTSEEEAREYDDETPMSVTELQDSIRRVLGADLPLGEPTRLSRFTFHARHAERYRAGRILLAGDAAHQFPSPGVALNAGLMDTVNLAWKLGADVRGWAPPGLLDTYHDERHFAGQRTLLHTQAQVALRRGHDPAAEALRELFSELVGDEQPLRRMAALIAGTDIRYPMPGAGQHALAGTFAPDLTLHTDHGTTTVAELMHTARPVLLDLADRRDLREAARGWRDRVDIRTARTDDRPADALLIRPDAHIAWAAMIDEPGDTAAAALREALRTWFGTPVKTAERGLVRVLLAERQHVHDRHDDGADDQADHRGGRGVDQPGRARRRRPRRRHARTPRRGGPRRRAQCQPSVVGSDEQDVAADPEHRDGADRRQRRQQLGHRGDQAAAELLGEPRRALRRGSGRRRPSSR